MFKFVKWTGKAEHIFTTLRLKVGRKSNERHRPQNTPTHKHPQHKQTIIIEWGRKELTKESIEKMP